MKERFTLFLLLVFPVLMQAQVTPTIGTVECFQVGDGGEFVDPGGPGGNPAVEGAPGNYPNCDCVTTTTLCSSDGSAVQVEILNFGLFAAFDWLVILDADNPLDEVYPSSILVDPNNVNLQLFNNADGAGDGGSENYGLGSEVNATTLADLPVTLFEATNASGCLTFVFRSSAVVDDPGWDALINVTSNAPHPGDDVPCDANITCYPPSNIQAILTPTTAEITWNPSISTNTYELEYGPAGFPPGTGTTVTVTGTTYLITGLSENTQYDVYVQAICGPNDVSALIGPYTFETPLINPPSECTYSLELFDSFGDGWNGSTLTVNSAGTTTTFTIPPGGIQAFYTFNVLDGEPIIITYGPGTFEGEVTYFMYDSDGELIFSDGPFPATGIVYEEEGSCPLCPAVSSSSIVIDGITSNSAEVDWEEVSNAQGYMVEYGPEGFPPGIGLMLPVTAPPVTLTGLNACVNYDVYVTTVCGPDTLANPSGPANFMTDFSVSTGDPCTYTLQLFDSFGDGWNGSSLSVTINGQTTNYTFDFGNSATFTINTFANSIMTFVYSPGFFENEVTYNIIDPDGNVIFSDGPFPQVGEVLTLFACPTCPGPLNFSVLDVNADNAILGWTPAEVPGDMILEYGPFGFTLGTGTQINLPSNAEQATLTGLTEGTWYNAYLMFSCDDTTASKTLGPLTFRTIWFNDVGVTGIVSPTAADCNLGAADTITIAMRNFGQYPQTLIPFYYAVNGEVAPIPVPTDGFFTGVIGNDSVEVIQFETTYDFSLPGYYLIEAWTELENDADRSNDTTRYELITAFPLPLQEDFESGVFPTGWTTDEFNPMYAPNAHNNPTYVIADNVYSFDPTFTVTTFRVGPLGANDSLTFDYRYVNWFAGTIATTLGPNDKLEVQISEDCGVTYNTVFTINNTNHVSSTQFATRTVNLAAYEGKAINVRFLATWGQGDYWVDLDNINITGCPGSLVVLGSVTDESSAGASDGKITADPTLGTGPYTYSWSNGGNGPTQSNLPAGEYVVTVTDANGCTDTKVFEVGIGSVSVAEVPFLNKFGLYPNPTSGSFTLVAELKVPADLTIQLYNPVGQLLSEVNEDNVLQTTRDFDLSEMPAGVYFLRVASQGQMYLQKVVLVK